MKKITLICLCLFISLQLTAQIVPDGYKLDKVEIEYVQSNNAIGLFSYSTYIRKGAGPVYYGIVIAKYYYKDLAPGVTELAQKIKTYKLIHMGSGILKGEVYKEISFDFLPTNSISYEDLIKKFLASDFASGYKIQNGAVLCDGVITKIIK